MLWAFLSQPKEAPMRKLAATDVMAPLCRDERGQTMAEYGVVLALVTLVVERSQSDAQAKPAHPEGGAASGA
jgi:hypothetical protein